LPPRVLIEHWPLKPARLPIPPPGQGVVVSATR